MTQANNSSESKRTQEWRHPAYDITEDADGLYVYLDMPGVCQDRLEVEYQNREITVTGSLDNSKFENFKLGWQEYRPYGFRRRFSIPEHIDADKITASLKDGVVKLTLPKSESVKPRRIAISCN
ncbi:MAG: Hsp20/alpha crystallin family protein [SAR324 cluster bacterium]|uniref:Hsp20/alpha crystallin family protein n=1 Tax=SAR324 cluster bacterium TaxID=2024889 RepID=A0A7X9IKS1_9DELT|nr:Hsp20/alpha crystallin family protein [SAR324 cluster bacterium]